MMRNRPQLPCIEALASVYLFEAFTLFGSDITQIRLNFLILNNFTTLNPHFISLIPRLTFAFLIRFAGFLILVK
jgi:hypothetical protein